MADYVVVQLNEDKAKKLSQVLANKTSKKILDHIADKPATESDIAASLKIPLSTVHYNLKLLEDARMVIADEYHYSKKGKVINHYRVAQHLVVIAPVQQRIVSLKAKLATIIPAVLVTFVGTWIVYAMEKARDAANAAGPAAQTMMAKTADIAAGNTAADESARLMSESVAESIAATPSLWQQTWPWFLVGGLVGIMLIVLIEWMMRKR